MFHLRRFLLEQIREAIKTNLFEKKFNLLKMLKKIFLFFSKDKCTLLTKDKHFKRPPPPFAPDSAKYDKYCTNS